MGHATQSSIRPCCCAWLSVLGLLAAIWVFGVSRVGSRVEGCPEACATLGQQSVGSLAVVSLNVFHDFPHFEHLSDRLDLIADEILRLDADIVCLQEVPWTLGLGNAAAHLAARTGMHYVYLRANGNRWAILFEEGEAILSRYPLQDAAFVELTPRAGSFEHRVVLRATAVTPWGKVSVFVTHLTDKDPELNRAQVESLAEFVRASADGLAIVAGDFNALEDSPQIRSVSRQWVDVHRTTHSSDPGFTCCIGDLSQGLREPLEKRIDYVFLVPGEGNGTRVIRSERVLNRPFRQNGGWLWASNHVGLLATIEVEP